MAAFKIDGKGHSARCINSFRNYLTTEKQTTKFPSASLKKNVKSKLYHIENSKTRGKTA